MPIASAPDPAVRVTGAKPLAGISPEQGPHERGTLMRGIVEFGEAADERATLTWASLAESPARPARGRSGRGLASDSLQHDLRPSVADV